MFHGYSGSSNGHYSVGQQREGRPRRGRGGTGGGVRASHHSQQFQERNPVPPCTEYDKAYFHAYSDIGIHEEMIKDHVRTSTYRAAIMRYQDSIAGKVVMDVGCGTGILAIFCALAGARRVLLKPSTTRSDCDFLFLMCCGSHLCLFLQVPGVTFPQHAAGSIEGFFQLVLVACSSLPCRKVFQELGKVLNDET